MTYGVRVELKDGTVRIINCEDYAMARVEELMQISHWADNPNVEDVRLVITEVTTGGIV